ncbi:MAG: hypothetical protein ACO23D_05730 [Candidatus Nanopelagicales bacterium]
MSVKIVHQNCDPSLAEDRTLPCTAYLVEYDDGNDICYDIVISNKKTDIFDYYWDKYREGLIKFTQTEGRVNPKLWGNQPKSSTKKK